MVLSPKFTWIPLGVEGGMNEGNLSAHMFAPLGSSDFLCVDAGTLFSGLKTAAQNNCFHDIDFPSESKLTREGFILHNKIKAFLITHAYIDHLSGLVLASPNDTPKPIISLEGTINDIKSHIFNWRTWPNFGDIGEPPPLNQYQYTSLTAGKPEPIKDTLMNVTAYPLAHGPHTDSTAFLIESDGYCILYLGDTGPDEVEKRTTTHDLWKVAAPLIKEKKLQGIFIEASYADERPDDELFSHLTPRWIMKAFHQLAELTDPKNPENALKDLNVIIMHIKPDFSATAQPRETIIKQLKARNDLGLNLIFAEQGKRREL